MKINTSNDGKKSFNRRSSELSRSPDDRAGTEETYRKAWRTALRILGDRAHSVYELRVKLRRRFDNGTAEKVLAELARSGYLNDLEFSQEYARQRFNRSPRASFMVVAELGRKGVDKETAAQAAALVLAGENTTERNLALNAARKKFLSLREKDEIELKLKLFRFLSRRGFNQEIALWAIEQSLASSPEV
jgi:regulatory protein